MSFASLSFKIVFIVSTYTWRYEFKRLLREYSESFTECWLHKSRSNKIDPTKIPVVEIRNGDGKQLQFSLNKEKDIYFEQLHEAWK